MFFENRLRPYLTPSLTAQIIAPNSLAGRLTKWFIGSSFLLIALVSALLYWGTTESLNWADDQVLKKRMLAMRDQIQGEEPNQGMIAHEVDEDVEGPRQIFIRVLLTGIQVNNETSGMDKVLPVGSFPDVSGRAFDSPLMSVLKDGGGRVFRSLAIRVPQNQSYAVIQMATDTTLDEEVLAWYRKLIAAVLGLAVLLCSLVGWQVVKQQLVPLNRIAEAASGIRTSTLNYRLSLDNMPGELQNLGEEFNQMLQRLETAYAGLSSYADNIAHEIRSPLNRILVGTEVTLSKSRDIDEYRSVLESNMEECERLNRLVQGLLFLARAENARVVLQKDSVDLGYKISSIESFFEEASREQGVDISVSCPDNLVIDGDGVLIQRAISNLVSNALSHTQRGGTIDVSAVRSGGNVSVIVTDTGEGIPFEHQPYVFDRFYRADESRGVEHGRLGLGLAIAKSIVHLHHGVISLRSAPAKGTSVTMVFPAASQDFRT